MRVTDDSTKTTAKFAGDAVGGGCIVLLPCDLLINTDDMGDNNTPFYDPQTKEEVFYGSWCSW